MAEPKLLIECALYYDHGRRRAVWREIRGGAVMAWVTVEYLLEPPGKAKTF